MQAGRGFGDLTGSGNGYGKLFLKVGVEGQTVTIVEEEPFRYVGHYWRHQMYPCEGELCAHCRAGRGIQVRFVLAVAVQRVAYSLLWEFGVATAKALVMLSEEQGGLKGLRVRVGREGGRPKGRLEVTLVGRAKTHSLEGLEIPASEAVMSRLWADQRRFLGSGAPA